MTTSNDKNTSSDDSHSSEQEVNGNSENGLNRSFSSMEVSTGKEEAEPLNEDTVVEDTVVKRGEIRREPTETWVEGNRNTLRRNESHPYVNKIGDASFPIFDGKKNT